MIMAGVTDKQVEQAQERVAKLRAELAEETEALATDEASRHNEYLKTLLGTEESRLKAELAAVKAQRKNSSAIIDQAIEQVATEGTPPVPPDDPTTKEQ